MKLTITIIRWIARFIGIFLFLFFVWFAMEIGTPDFDMMSLQEIKLFAANLLMLIGLIIVWKFEFIGSIILIGSYVFFSIVNFSFWIGPVFPNFLLIGILHLFCWITSTILSIRKSNFTINMLLK
ncbi:DUF7670 domain-containing protein [Marinifilum sp. RC60d5]|uniref:DUF7670 domain-containing protein n=1 Tax=Marinifilum sp. RC60d5 TaxID=3458414 RepID=UPI004036AC75